MNRSDSRAFVRTGIRHSTPVSVIFFFVGIIIVAIFFNSFKWRTLENWGFRPTITLVFMIMFGIMVLLSFINMVSKRGFLFYTMDLPVDLAPRRSVYDFANRIRDLEELRSDGLISDEEYKAKRQEIMDHRW